jgi:hypothetical protein
MATVGILTLHLHVNYGGILQAAALYRLLKDEGFQPLILRKEPENRSKFGRTVRNLMRRLPLQNIGGVRARALARAKHSPFMKRFLPNTTSACHNEDELREAVARYGLDAVVVGSDQVWRFEYHQDSNYAVYFLNFVPSGTLKISYAASFGHEHWQYVDKTEEVSALLADFDAVSVREESGVEICRATLGVAECRLVLDPTLVVDPALYVEAAAPPRTKSCQGLVNYVLDRNEGSELAQRHVEAALPEAYRTTLLSIGDEQRQADIGQWLRTFMDADFVVTDSYHGTIFSILFGKNFIAFGNRDRGLDRFTTLLDQLGLLDRLVLDHDLSKIVSLVQQPIDYAAVNERLDLLRKLSRELLIRSLAPVARAAAKP